MLQSWQAWMTQLFLSQWLEQKVPVPGQDFFPLTVDFQEKVYSAGRIPGGFFRREGRPSEKEILICRLIDRPMRPLFPKGYVNEVQIICTVISINPDVDPDLVAMLGTSAALATSGLPFNGPVGAARVGYINGEYVLNPGAEALKESDLDLVVAGTESAVLMVESEANMLSEEVMLGSVMFGHEQSQIAINAIRELAAEVNTPQREWVAAEKDESLLRKWLLSVLQALKKPTVLLKRCLARINVLQCAARLWTRLTTMSLLRRKLNKFRRD